MKKKLGPIPIAIFAGAGYGLAVRLFLSLPGLGVYFLALSLAFMIVLPFTVGFISVGAVRAPSWPQRIFLPWASCVVMATVAALIGWEGGICIALGLPIMLVASSLGGIAATRRRRVMVAMAFLPIVLNPIEGLIGAAPDYRTAETSIFIQASPGVVWRNIVSVPTIQEAELRPRLIHRLGFPRPLAATLENQRLGGQRLATFAGGVVFVETVTVWEPGRALGFSIDPDTANIPATTLDQHVTVGGEYFDVLNGRYDVIPSGDSVTLRLVSHYRVSTHLNFYTGPWADFVMRSIQDSILEVIKARSETGGI